MSRLGTPQKSQLEDALHLFNQLSEQLTHSYRGLEDRVARLNDELTAVRSERLKQLAEKERLANRLRNLLDALPGGVVVLDGAGRVQDCNPAAQTLLGEGLVGESWSDVIAQVFAPRGDDGHEVSLRDGRVVSISTCPLGAEPGQILLLQDMTEARALRERLNRHKRLSAMGEVAARLAHQIRTPLAAALLYVSHLTRPRLEGAEVQRIADKILARLRHLDILVRDMLVFARGGSTGTQEIRVGQLVDDLQHAAAPLLAAASSRMEIDAGAQGLTLRGNREALLGALQNLVSNAIQACGSGGRLQLKIEADGEEAVRFLLSDNGPGIPPELHERVFEPFFTTRDQGTGLGLAVVLAVARAHNGLAWLESEPGRGSTFGLLLPVAEDRRRRTEDRRLKTEDGGARTKMRGRNIKGYDPGLPTRD